MTRSLALYGLLILVPAVVAYLFSSWDILALTAAALGISMITTHWSITRRWRGPTVPRRQ